MELSVKMNSIQDIVVITMLSKMRRKKHFAFCAGNR